jgi:hypothetical protein
MTLGPPVLEFARWRWVRVVGAVFCLFPCLYLVDLWRPLWDGPKDSVGKMDGTQWLTRDEFPRLMLGRMKVEKPGVAIERPSPEGGFTNSAALPLFAEQKMLLGWYGHELLWRANREDIRRRHDKLMLFYDGGVPHAGEWLAGQGVDYVLWYQTADTPQLWVKLNASLAPEYIWCEILTYTDALEDGRRLGFWRRSPETRR